MDQIIKNLYILMWLCVKGNAYDYSSENALVLFSERVGLQVERLRELLSGKAVLSDQEIDRISCIFGFSKEELCLSNLLDEFKVNVLSENIGYLFRQLPRGGLAEYAKWSGVDPSTINRWIHGQTPGKQNLEKIREYFQLNDSEDLEESLLFLSLGPVGDRQRKNECMRLLGELKEEEFSKMYHAIKKLLS